MLSSEAPIGRMVASGRLASIVLWGPPGSGKTTIARLLAHRTKLEFEPLSAVFSGVADLRKIFEAARKRREMGEGTLLFVDELHHFNRTQQDVLLPDVESGVVRLIGATTANPFFSLVSPLVSRSQIFEFQPLQTSDIRQLLDRALTDTEHGLGRFEVTATEEALGFLAEVADGDARRALNALEIGVFSIASGGTDTERVLELDVAEESVQKKAVHYDDDMHYDAASALIKSLRGSDPDAAIYWLARMLEAGEDPRFLARRLVILASEDIGNADPQALVLANAAAQATERVGMPECRIILAQATCYLALAPKSNASYLAIDRAIEDVRTRAVLPVPRHLKDSHYPGAGQLGHGEDYAYAHDGDDGWVDQDYLGVDRTYYEPTDRGHEEQMKKRLEELKRRQGEESSGGTG